MMARNAAAIFLLGFAVTDVAGQTASFTLGRFGRLSVTDAEVAQIAELVIGTGKRPWLLRTPHSMITDLRVADLFLEPDVLGARVQRGRMMNLVADGPPYVPPRSPWKMRNSHSYAYIPAQGRRVGDIRSDSDIDWPFIVEGEFDDDTLISVVEFIRSQPGIPMPAFRQKVSAAPISHIARRDDSVVVALRTSEDTGDRVWLARRDGQWVITRSESWIV